jgi:hypothetical protein
MEMSEPTDKRRTLAPHLIIAVTLTVALADNSDGYYEFLRWIVSGSFSYLSVQSYRSREQGWLWTWAVAAGIFNPIIPIAASRDLWSLVDVISTIVVTFDAIKGHKLVGRIKNGSGILARSAGALLMRIVLASAMLVVIFFVLDFSIARWG